MRGGKEREVVWAASGQVGVGGLCLSRNQTGTRRRKKKNQAKQRSPSSSLTNPRRFLLERFDFYFLFHSSYAVHGVWGATWSPCSTLHFSRLLCSFTRVSTGEDVKPPREFSTPAVQILFYINNKQLPASELYQ